MFKFAATLLLGSVVFAAPLQDAGHGPADDLAKLLPEDAMAFVEITRPHRLLRDWKAYVGALCTKSGSANFCGEIQKGITPMLDMIPEKLRKDLESGLGTIQRFGAAMIFDGPMPTFVFMLSTTDAGWVRKIVSEDLKVFSSDEKTHQGFTILEIRKLGEMRMPEPVYVAAAGHRLIVSLKWSTLLPMLDRAAGKSTAPDFRTHRLFKAFTAPAGEDPQLRAAFTYPWHLLDGMDNQRRRANQVDIDQVDAILDFLKIHGGTVEATLAPGKFTTVSRIQVDSPCRLYTAFRQPAGPKETMKYLPPGTSLVVHANIKGAREVWADVEEFLKRGEAALSKGRSRPGRRTLAEEVSREMTREIGIDFAEMAPVLGKEGAFGLVADDAFTGAGQEFEEALFFAVQVADLEKAKALATKMFAKVAGGEPEGAAEGEVTIYSPPGKPGPAFAFHGSTFLYGGKTDHVRSALKAFATGAFLKNLPESAKNSSKIFGMRHSFLWTFLAHGLRLPLPAELKKDLELSAWSFITATEEDSTLQLCTTDAGPGVVGHALLTAAPLILPVGFSPRHGREVMAPPDPKPAIQETGPLPPDKLAERVKTALENLRSEEMTAREGADTALRELGKQAIPLLVETVKKETDIEVKSRLYSILLDWKAYDALPELVDQKVDAFVGDIMKFMEGRQRGQDRLLASWQRRGNDTEFSPWTMEPYLSYSPSAFGNRDLLDIPLGLKKLAERLKADKVAVEVQRNLAIVLAYEDCSKAGDAVTAAWEAVTDADTKAYLQIALGWVKSPKAVEAIIAGFKNPDRMISRASFIAADRVRDAAVADSLLALVSVPDFETRWNASYVLRAMTNKRMSINVFLPEEEVKVQVAAAAKWLESNRNTLK